MNKQEDQIKERINYIVNEAKFIMFIRDHFNKAFNITVPIRDSLEYCQALLN